MFRHRGKSRTLLHNLKVASLLSFVAGIVNVSGLFAVQRLTTNVTGHFAFFADELVQHHIGYALVFLLYIVAFLFGAFSSSVMVEMVSRINERYINTVPIALETAVLAFIGLMTLDVIKSMPDVIACTLLFAMGLQNALVTSLSNSVVRTTHLTGLFTDLGIELSQLLFFRQAEQQKRLLSSIRLRVTIIFFFFLGGITGGYGYLMVENKVLLLAALILLGALFYDTVKLKLVQMKRRHLK
jgi:uncharacterized membrane protein YoaK (UPF0700 family)